MFQNIKKRVQQAAMIALACCTVACIDGRFQIDSTSPEQGEKNVSRTSAIIVKFLADEEIPDGYFTEDYFSLEDLGSRRKGCDAKDMSERDSSKDGTSASTSRPTLSVSSSTAGADDEEEDSASPERTSPSQRNEKDDPKQPRTANPVKTMIWEAGYEEAVGANKEQVFVYVAVSPLEVLKSKHCYRLTVAKDIADAADNELLVKHKLYFSTGLKPEVKSPRVLASTPPGITSGNRGAIDDGEQETPAETPSEPAVPERVRPVKDVQTTIPTGSAIADDQPFLVELSEPVNYDTFVSWVKVYERRDNLNPAAKPAEVFLVDNPFDSNSRLRTYIISVGRMQEEIDIQIQGSIQARGIFRAPTGIQAQGTRTPIVQLHVDSKASILDVTREQREDKARFYIEGTEDDAPAEDPSREQEASPSDPQTSPEDEDASPSDQAPTTPQPASTPQTESAPAE